MHRARKVINLPFGGESARLGASPNGKALFEQTISDPADRSFHEILDTKILRPTDNALTLIRRSDSGVIRPSDLVLIYAI
jgi:hypothetical protein